MEWAHRAVIILFDYRANVQLSGKIQPLIKCCFQIDKKIYRVIICTYERWEVFGLISIWLACIVPYNEEIVDAYVRWNIFIKLIYIEYFWSFHKHFINNNWQIKSFDIFLSSTRRHHRIPLWVKGGRIDDAAVLHTCFSIIFCPPCVCSTMGSHHFWRSILVCMNFGFQKKFHHVFSFVCSIMIFFKNYFTDSKNN